MCNDPHNYCLHFDLCSVGPHQVWECRLDPRIKFRVKNDFVQWQMKGGGGEPVMYGIRLKDSEVAAQVGTATSCHVIVM